MASKIYNFKTPLLDLDDSIVIEQGKECILSEILANNIRNASITEDIVIKFFGWAIDLKKTGQLSLDNDDVDKLKKYILSNQFFPVITKARFAEVLDGNKK